MIHIVAVMTKQLMLYIEDYCIQVKPIALVVHLTTAAINIYTFLSRYLSFTGIWWNLIDSSHLFPETIKLSSWLNPRFNAMYTFDYKRDPRILFSVNYYCSLPTICWELITNFLLCHCVRWSWMKSLLTSSAVNQAINWWGSETQFTNEHYNNSLNYFFFLENVTG